MPFVTSGDESVDEGWGTPFESIGAISDSVLRLGLAGLDGYAV